jgi:hypothetical protein
MSEEFDAGLLIPGSPTAVEEGCNCQLMKISHGDDCPCKKYERLRNE